jgi:hypothetical protein
MKSLKPPLYLYVKLMQIGLSLKSVALLGLSVLRRFTGFLAVMSLRLRSLILD